MEFPHLGEHCSEPTCNRLDFLPLRCDRCSAIFCREHFGYAQHGCAAAGQRDVQVPVCPLCDAPVPSKPGDPPDIAVGRHIDDECQSDLKKRKGFTNKCSSKGCKVREIVQVRCSDCRRNFCLRHRHPADHDCNVEIRAKSQPQRNEEKRKIEEKRNNEEKRRSGSQRRNGELLRSLQGEMSEDEALARALQASMREESGSGHRCRLSSFQQYRDGVISREEIRRVPYKKQRSSARSFSKLF